MGRLDSVFTGEEMGQFFAHASGRMKLLETTSGRTVGELSFKRIKGGHIGRRQALQRAVDNAAAELRAALKAKLAELN